VLLAFELTQSVVILSTWVAAVVADDLVETLSSPGPFTVFAPTKDAFAPLPKGSLASWLLPDILTYHVIDEEVLSSDLKAFPGGECC